ncbi:MAG: hypothetical protein GY710_19675 [Desulfobacteraceae bacterium]|nr:hypothetical protein [Desulfobacteraceae bacterium]
MSKKKKSLVLLINLMLFVAVLLFFGLTPYRYRASNPGPLSTSHLFLLDNCNACHTTARSVDPEKCRFCHDTDAIVFNRQVVSFHSTITSCKECHVEHHKTRTQPTLMNHDALTLIFKRQILKNDSMNGSKSDTPQEYTEHKLHEFEKILSDRYPLVDAKEAILNCTTCHSDQDPHQGSFGSSCIECHTIDKWSVPGYIHPPDTNRDCKQCHIGPLCHYTPMFKKRCEKMLGKKDTDVNACYVCHTVNSWQYLKGIGWFTIFPYSAKNKKIDSLSIHPQ